MLTLQPPKIPRPVSIPIWTDDYTDIQVWIRKYGRFDTEEIWFSNSDDSWDAFCGRHGYYNFYYDWKDNPIPQRVRRSVVDKSFSKAAQLQYQWENEQLQRRREQQRLADIEWEAAKATAIAINQGLK